MSVFHFNQLSVCGQLRENKHQFNRMMKIQKGACFTMLLIVLLCLAGCGSADSYTMDTETVTTDSVDASALQGEAVELVDQNLDDALAASHDAVTDTGVIVVDVDGAVLVPGVYELPAGSRVQDALDRAGGVTDVACTKGMNRAMVLSDGLKLYIPTTAEYEEGIFVDGITAGYSGEQDTASYAKDSEDTRININTADAAALCQIKGIGETRADAIVAYREQHGAFADISDIQNVSGIGASTYEKIKDQIRVK